MFHRGESLTVSSIAFFSSFGPETKMTLKIQLCQKFVNEKGKHLSLGGGVRSNIDPNNVCFQERVDSLSIQNLSNFRSSVLGAVVECL